jgi:ABC-type lipoprotein export system ATPase subunit
MKIHKIILKNYQQFKDLEIDLTYPAGHEKAGQPLDKVCFIGQSGTGKTSLLRLIKCCVTTNPCVSPEIRLTANALSHVEIEYGDSDPLGFFLLEEDKSEESTHDADAVSTYYEGMFPSGASPENLEFHPGLIDFPAEFTRISLSEEHFNSSKKTLGFRESKDSRLEQYLGWLDWGYFVDLNFQNFEAISSNILSKIAEYQTNEVVHSNKLKEAVLSSSSPSVIEAAKAEYQSWSNSNQNPLVEIAKVCEPILQTFGVRVKTEVDYDTIQHLGTIRLQTLTGTNLPPENWSTGIKQLIHTAATLVHLYPRNAVILVDEPEKSLYPDIQAKIIDFYTSLTTDCQFFYATHSPIIASSFDPWEIVELKFDETNQFVKQETNFIGDRHVDNYTVYPKYLKWDGILMKLFDLMEDGNSEYRIDALMQASMLKAQLEKMKTNNENSGPVFEEKLAEYIQLKKKVGWA